MESLSPSQFSTFLLLGDFNINFLKPSSPFVKCRIVSLVDKLDGESVLFVSIDVGVVKLSNCLFG